MSLPGAKLKPEQIVKELSKKTSNKNCFGQRSAAAQSEAREEQTREAVRSNNAHSTMLCGRLGRLWTIRQTPTAARCVHAAPRSPSQLSDLGHSPSLCVLPFPCFPYLRVLSRMSTRRSTRSCARSAPASTANSITRQIHTHTPRMLLTLIIAASWRQAQRRDSSASLDSLTRFTHTILPVCAVRSRRSTCRRSLKARSTR